MSQLQCAIVVAVSWAALLTVPVHAQMMCQHEEDTFDGLRACISHALEVGHIENAGIAQSLLAKVDTAESLHDSGHTGAAISTLYALESEVEALPDRLIRPEHRAHLVAHVERVIASLST
jgi:hypothetical protein